MLGNCYVIMREIYEDKHEKFVLSLQICTVTMPNNARKSKMINLKCQLLSDENDSSSLIQQQPIQRGILVIESNFTCNDGADQGVNRTESRLTENR